MQIQMLLQLMGYLVVLFLLWDAGTAFTRLVLEKSGAGKRERDLEQRNREKNHLEAEAVEARPSADNNSGRYIGLLERTLIAAGLVWNNWEVILAVIALKTVARHSELNDKIDAEYFLIGSFASILWAIGVAVLLVLYDQVFGFGFLPTTWLFGAAAAT